jgi:hypothetical protein
MKNSSREAEARPVMVNEAAANMCIGVSQAECSFREEVPISLSFLVAIRSSHILKRKFLRVRVNSAWERIGLKRSVMA